MPMSDQVNRASDIYQRLLDSGVTEEEIEAVHRKLREAGYGEEAMRRRLEALARDRASGGRRPDGSASASGAAARGGANRGGSARRDESAQTEGGARLRGRARDWFPEVPRGLRRRINKWAYQNRLKITGLRERWLDFVSIFRQATPDLVNPALLELLARRKHYLSVNPYSYSLVTTLDALYQVARLLLGRTGRNESERVVGESLRRKDAFAFEYLSRFAHHDEELRASLAWLELAHENRRDVEASALARVTRETWRLVLSTEEVSRGKIDHVLAVARDALLASGTYDERGITLDDAAAIFQICLENLQRFKLELYPIVLRAIGAFYEPGDQSPTLRERTLDFVDLADEEILTVRGFYQQEARRRERALAEQQLLELEAVEREKEAGFSRRFSGVLAILDALFPDSGIAEIERHAFLVPYFAERVFVRSLTFDRGRPGIEWISRYDPLQPVLVVHRIVDNLLNAVDHARLEQLLGRDDLAEPLAGIKDEWAAIYGSIFDPYVAAVAEYARGIRDAEFAGRFPQTNTARRLEQEINALRNRAVRSYGHAVPDAAGAGAPRLWSLADRLTLLLDTIGDEIHGDLAKRSDPVSRRVYEGLGDQPVVGFAEHATPGSPGFKPVVRQVRRYVEAKYRSSFAAIPRVAQLFLLDLLRGIAELYRSLLGDESSFLRAAGGRIVLAGSEEEAAWKRERASRGGDLTERLRIRLDESLVTEFTDALTGMRTKNFYLQHLPAAYDRVAQAGKPISLVMVDIDHFKWINDELGHQKGDDVLKDAATTILDGIRRGSDIAIRYGGEELMVVTTVPLHQAVALAERLRHAQATHLEDRDLYEPIGLIGREKGEPCGTFSVGVAARLRGESLDDLVARADRALYQAKATRNTVIVARVDDEGAPRFERYADFAARVRKRQGAGPTNSHAGT